jgi:hypothetical protein
MTPLIGVTLVKLVNLVKLFMCLPPLLNLGHSIDLSRNRAAAFSPPWIDRFNLFSKMPLSLWTVTGKLSQA